MCLLMASDWKLSRSVIGRFRVLFFPGVVNLLVEVLEEPSQHILLLFLSTTLVTLLSLIPKAVAVLFFIWLNGMSGSSFSCILFFSFSKKSRTRTVNSMD
uniref:Uncharacterized protein n=1 Tax=Cacopsylla melanoneura TaxID=428564 RepID=A0A8D8ZLS3_9HEMI